MARIIIGAGTGYLLGLFFVALTTSGDSGSALMLNKAAIFDATYPLNGLNQQMLICVAVGAVMGWAWHSIAIDAGSKDD